jgi:hypothetical protein
MAKKTIKNEELIDVMCYTSGTLVYVNSRTTERWVWDGYGDIQPIPFQELKYMKSGQPKFINEPWVLIMNDDVVDALRLTNFYENIVKPSEMDNFFRLSTEKMDEILEKAPSGVKLLITNYAKQKIASQEFSDLFKIKYLEGKLNADLIEE